MHSLPAPPWRGVIGPPGDGRTGRPGARNHNIAAFPAGGGHNPPPCMLHPSPSDACPGRPAGRQAKLHGPPEPLPAARSYARPAPRCYDPPPMSTACRPVPRRAPAAAALALAMAAGQAGADAVGFRDIEFEAGGEKPGGRAVVPDRRGAGADGARSDLDASGPGRAPRRRALRAGPDLARHGRRPAEPSRHGDPARPRGLCGAGAGTRGRQLARRPVQRHLGQLAPPAAPAKRGARPGPGGCRVRPAHRPCAHRGARPLRRRLQRARAGRRPGGSVGAGPALHPPPRPGPGVLRLWPGGRRRRAARCPICRTGASARSRRSPRWARCSAPARSQAWRFRSRSTASARTACCAGPSTPTASRG